MLMVLTKTDTQNQCGPGPWCSLSLLNVCYGYYSGFAQLRLDEKKKAKWFIAAMHFFAVFYLLTVINQLTNNDFGNMLGTKLFFPINLFPVSFIVIIGIRLRANSLEEIQAGEILRLQDVRWDWLVQNMQLLIVELDNAGMIKYLNPYAVKRLDI
jgi:PAS domain-containing protein